jgi:hypothetical protein
MMAACFVFEAEHSTLNIQLATPKGNEPAFGVGY